MGGNQKVRLSSWTPSGIDPDGSCTEGCSARIVVFAHWMS